MINGKDLSYCSYGDNTIIGNLALEDVITNSEIVINTHYAYAKCAGITSISSYMISFGDYSYSYDYTYDTIRHEDNVTYIDTYNCYYYTAYTYINDYKETSLGYVSDMSGMFSNSYNIITADLSKVNISLCNNMDSMFAGCESLQTITFGEYIPQTNLHCENIFKNCYNLETVYIPSALKYEYSNISGNALEHVLYYNHHDIDLPHETYTYLKSVTTREEYRTIQFILKHIGVFIIEDEISWDMVKIQINGETIFYMNIGEYRPTDEILKLKSHILLNDHYMNNKLDVNIYNDNLATDINVSFTVDVLYKYDVVKSITVPLVVPSLLSKYVIDINSIYITENDIISNPITFVNGGSQYTYTYLRANNSLIRSNFNNDTFEMNFPDGYLIKEIDAITGEESYTYEKTYGDYAYVFVNMYPGRETIGYDNNIAYMIQLKDKNINI